MKKNVFYFLPILFVFTFVCPLQSQDSDYSTKEQSPAIAQNVETQKDTLDQNDFKAVEKMPEVITQVNPVYPPDALEKDIEGKVYLKISIDVSGNPTNVEVVKSSDPIFNKSAITAAKNYKFTPALKDGKPVAVSVVIPFKFSLSKEKKENRAAQECYYQNADEMPSIIGGMTAILKKLTYPEAAKKKKLEGKVLIKIYVHENGSIDATNIIKGIGYGCDEAAEKAVRECKFSPAKKDGKNVKAQVILPIQFKLK